MGQISVIGWVELVGMLLSELLPNSVSLFEMVSYLALESPLDAEAHYTTMTVLQWLALRVSQQLVLQPLLISHLNLSNRVTLPVPVSYSSPQTCDCSQQW